MSGLLRCLSRRLHLRCLGPLVLICFMLSVFYLALTPVEQDDTQMFNARAAVPFVNASALTHESGHHLGIIIPFRDVWNELMIFVPHMHTFLNRQHIKHTIYAINQVDILRFNRASLINVGFIQALDDGCDYIAMHDVDLLPLNNDLSYAYPERGPFHIAAPEFHPKYHYDDFVGGILLLTTEHYKQVNGLSNKYWGWGLEDDEFRARLKEQKLQVYRPTGITTGNRTLLHIHDSKERKRDYKRYGDQKQQSKRRDRITGVDSVQYTIISTNNLTIEDAPVQMLNVNLYCDLDFTPYCITPEQLQLYEGGSLTRAHGYLSKKPR